MSPLEVRADEACCELCGQGERRLTVLPSGLVVDVLCALSIELEAPRLALPAAGGAR